MHVNKITHNNTNSHETNISSIAKYKFDNLFSSVTINKKLYFSGFLQFPDIGYGKGSKKVEKSNEKT